MKAISFEETLEVNSGSGKLREGQGGVAGHVLRADVLPELGGVPLLSVLDSAVADNTCVDSARYAIRKLHVDLGHLEVIRAVSVVFLDISL